MQVQDGVAVESRLLGLIHQQLDGRLVIQEHLRFQRILAFGRFAQGQKAFGFEQGIGIAFQAARVPRQIDQQAIPDMPGISARRLPLAR